MHIYGNTRATLRGQSLAADDLPAYLRGLLKKDGLRLFSAQNPCLVLMHALDWGDLSEKLKKLPMGADSFKRLIYSSYREIPPTDTAIDFPAELLTSCGISRSSQVCVVGMGHYVEIWSVEQLLKSERMAVSRDMPESVKSLVV